MKLDKWQQKILDCKAKYILLCKGRQIGGTYIFARKCAERLISQKGCQIVVASLTEDQAQLVIAMVLAFLEKNYKSLIKKPYSRNVTKSVINLKTGSGIISRPVGSTGNSIRGFTGHVLYLNEASRMPEFIFEAAKPILLTTAGDIWMDSTPFGMEGYFYKSWLNKNKRFKVFYHTSEEVIQNRKISFSWTKQQRESALIFLKEEKDDMTRNQFKQEYLGEFIGGIKRFFSDDWIASVCTLAQSSNKEVSLTKAVLAGRDLFLGVDIAGLGEDSSTFESLDGTNQKKVFQVAHETTTKTRTTETTRKIIELNRKWDYNKIGVDDGGMGVGVFDHLLEEDETKRKVIALNNAKRVIDRDDRKKRLLKEDMYNNLLAMGERGEIKLFNSEDIIHSFRSIQADDSEGVLKIFGIDTHIVEGAIRAAQCIKEKGLSIFIYY